jgi:hypothetical protein
VPSRTAQAVPRITPLSRIYILEVTRTGVRPA